MSSKTVKSILKAPTVDLFEEVEEPRRCTRAELLFDQLIGPEVTLKKFDNHVNTYANRQRKPLMAKNDNLLADLRPIDSSLSDIESKDNFEPSAKTSRTRIKKAVDKRQNRVKFAESPTKKATKKTQNKKVKDYPQATPQATLEAYQKVNLDYLDELPPLHTSKYTDRASPPLPSLHEIMAPFSDLLPSGWEAQDLHDKQQNKSESDKQKSCGEWETEESSHYMSANNMPFDDHQEIDNTVFSESVKSSELKSNTSSILRPDFRRDSLRTAAIGGSRIASTPVRQLRHNVTLAKNVSPIVSIESPEVKSPVNDVLEKDTFVKPKPPKKKSIRKVSTPIKDLKLDVVEPSLSDLDKVKLHFNDRSRRYTRTLMESPKRSYILTEPPKSPISESDDSVFEDSPTVVKENTKSVDSLRSQNTLRSRTPPLRQQRTRMRLKTIGNELSSIFNPKVKSTPLALSSKYNLVVDRSHFDVSIAKMCRSMSTSALQNIPKTTTIVPVIDRTSQSVSKTRQSRHSKKDNNVYHMYRKSIASVNSALNKTCQPSRTVIHTTALDDHTLEHPSDVTIKDVFANQNELKQCFNKSISTSMFMESKIVGKNIEKTIVLTPKKKVLLYCEPNEVIDFKKCFNKQILEKCRKIGEGSYGEVYASKDKDGRDVVIKIIPLVRNENQTEDDLFGQILPELVISLNFNALKTGIGCNRAPNFIDMIKASTTRGKFPHKLIQEWDKFDAERRSENEDPRSYTKEQLYIVFYLANGGQDLENYLFDSAVESLSVILQLCLALAAAEVSLEFEHRDLHWGNVLIANTTEQSLQYTIDGKDYVLNPCGVFASIIDFSLSRMRDNDFIIYDDLAKYSDLFEGRGDYQFDIYRMMRSHNEDNWQRFAPKTNIFWLHYLLDKAINEKKYKKFRTNVHKEAIKMLNAIKDSILDFDSAADLIRSQHFSQYLSKLNS